MKYSFIGVGNMGGALVKCLLKSVETNNILLCEHHPEKIEGFLKAGCLSVSLSEAALADYIFVGVKPYKMEEVLTSLDSIIAQKAEPTVIISMAASTSISTMKKWCHSPIVRIMPNIPIATGDGVIMMTSDELVSENDMNHLRNILQYAGLVLDLQEKYFEAGSSIAGCSPAFVAMFIEALADGAVECGLPRKTALQLAESAVAGTSNYLAKTMLHPGQLKDAVCSPGGTTIAGVHALEEGGFRNSVMNSITASYQKSIDNSKK